MKADSALLTGQLPQVQGEPPKWLIGVDEVGRGCLAGPVVVGASLWVLGVPSELQRAWQQQISDSKTISEKKREKIFAAVAENSLLYVTRDIDVKRTNCFMTSHIKASFLQTKSDNNTVIKNFEKNLKLKKEIQDIRCEGTAVKSASEREIEQLNIWGAVQLAAGRALLKLAAQFPEVLGNLSDGMIVVDGHKPILVPSVFQQTPQVCLVKGDLHLASVGLASICAKVLRDRYMTQLGSKILKGYGLDKHKGYATKLHREAILKYGPTEYHRASFLGNILQTHEIKLF